ncbi:unnamed protein product [Symbiodinium necroappetens]|uniref:Endonuclease/exonuclease/phosphatase domain-containing protein n=1 Tax=Symbiodinium necroappetens TaxID=1628268 RepID=A0A813BTA8_9DINO|nr:unnamed protein product [Symbiodinium necroappetens]
MGIGRGANTVASASELARCMVRDGMEHPALEAVASLGNGGRCESNAERDLHRWLKDLYGFELDTYEIAMELAVNNSRCVEQVPVHVLLPHEVMHAIFTMGATQVIPITFHVDGAEMYSDDEYFVYSFSSAFGGGGLVDDVLLHKFPLVILAERDMCLPGAASGLAPRRGFYGEEWPLDSYRRKWAGEHEVLHVLATCTWSLVKCNGILDAGGLILSTSEAREASDALFLHLRTYEFLAEHYWEERLMLFKIRPKAHSLLHTAREILEWQLNVSVFHTWSDESFLGKLKKIATQCHGKTMTKRVFERYRLYMAFPTTEISSSSGEPGGHPQASPKRAREDNLAGDDDLTAAGDQPLTLALLQQALQVSQQHITNTIHASLEGSLSTLSTRVAQVEANMEEHVKRTTNLLDAMTDRHCHIEGTVKQSAAVVDDVRRRLELLEGKFATDAETTLKLVREHIARLQARVVTGDRPEGGHRYFWAAMSESPERRKRAQFSGKVKRLILESEGDRRLIQVEFGTGNVWYDGTKISSAVTSAPPGGEKIGAGWIHLPSLARQLGTSLTELTERWDVQDTDLYGMHVVTWNVGGLTIDKLLKLLCDLRKERIRPFDSAFVLCLQEIIMDKGKAVQEQDDLQCVCGRQDEDWRGTGIVHTSQFKHSRNKLLRSGFSTCLSVGELRFTVVSGHLPHHATMPEADEIATTWLQQLRSTPKAILGMDANETFSEGISGKVTTHSGRGEQLFSSLSAADFRLPPQKLEKASFFPYNTNMRPRRLDYVMVKHLLCREGEVLSLRDVASSDHEPIWTPLLQPSPPPTKSEPKPWGSRRLRDWRWVEQVIARPPPVSGDMVQEITNIAVQITRPGRALANFAESKPLRQQRRRALRLPAGGERKAAWKAVQKAHREEHRAWKVQQLDLAGKGWWKAKEAVDRDTHDSSWELRLRADERWRQTLQDHFGGIFNKSDAELVAAKLREISDRLSRLCKQTAWEPFTAKELHEVRKRWSGGKACGPDSVSHEALRVLEHDDRWRGTLLYVLNDFLYTAAVPKNVERGITVLLAKTGNPEEWSETRPITLSSALLKTFSQLLIGVELILILRRVCRESLAEQIEADVGVAGDRPWEARAWTNLIHANEINIYFRGEEFRIPQTNGVRQGAPDSPIAFGRVLAVELEKAVQQARGQKPTTGDPPPEDAGAFMDDSYIWSTKKEHLQAMLTHLGANLPPKGLDIHPLKTEII